MSSPVTYLSPGRLRRDLGARDLSDPAEGPHAIQTLIGQAVESLSRAWRCEVRWCRGPRIVPVADNYDRLGYAAEAITRDARYTRYVAAGRMLRSHSTAMVSPALRRLAVQPADDVLLVCPGIVYRRDAIDWQHSGTPHQPVSAMPAITRDLSVAVAADDDEETIGDRVRDALGTDARCVEEVRVLSVTPCRELPAVAVARLGASPGQQNVLVRVVIRDLDRTLTNKAANALRDRIYQALHQGKRYQWAG